MPHVEEAIQLPRDFKGFGEQGHDARWPNGARIAISFILNYEEGGERSWQDGDGLSEPYLWEKGSSGGVKPGGRHLNSEHDFEYGSRSGCWRIFRLMKEFGFKMTLYAIAQAMERNPEFTRACVVEGHEIAAHGLRWLEFWDYNVEQDKKYIKDTFAELERVTGERPVGFYFGRGTPQTHVLVPEVCRENGWELKYSSEAYNDDVPYWVDLPSEELLVKEGKIQESEKKGMLIVPYNYDWLVIFFYARYLGQVKTRGSSYPKLLCHNASAKTTLLSNDGKFHMAPGFVTSAGQMYEDYLKSTFDCLYREGGKMMNIPMHSRIVGKPGRSEALRRFMQYISSKEGVWVTTRRDIADHYRTTFPYKSGSKAGGS